MTVLPVDAECCGDAVASNEPDFEDAIIRAAAEQAHAEFIVSKDMAAFANSRVRRIVPADVLTLS